MDSTHLEVFNTDKDGKSRRVTRLSWNDRRKPIEIFHELDRIIPFSDDTPLDGHILVVLLYAASLGKPLVVHGPVSRTALRNINELLLAWNRWRPDLYKAIDVLPDRAIDVRSMRQDESTIAAFSGGVDGTFLALQHATPGEGKDCARLRINSTLLVHGFDVDVYNFDGFNQLIGRVRPLLNYLNLELRTIRTNSRDLRLQDWEDSSGLELAGCLHMYGNEFQYALIGSGAPYENLRAPWGSSPIIDHLMSGDLMNMIHDGAGYSRIEKVAEIARHPIAVACLKVCWAGADQSANCGSCEKCIRTRLNFLAAGVTATPACFDREFDPALIRSVALDNDLQKMEFDLNLQYALKHGRTGAWIALLQERLRNWAPVDEAVLDRKKYGGGLKRAAVRLAEVAGVSEQAKKVWRPLRRAFLQSWGSLF